MSNFKLYCARSVKQKDLVLELASAGAFKGSHKDYFLHESKELTSLINDGIIDCSPLLQCFFLTDAAQQFIAPRFQLKYKSNLNKYARFNTPLKDRTTLELIAELSRKGWSAEQKAPGGRIPIYTSSRCKQIWCYQDNKSINRLYLMSLLSVDRLLQAGLPGVAHLQLDSYYRAIMHCLESSPDKLKEIIPNKHAGFYHQVMGLTTAKSKLQSTIALEAEPSIHDQLSVLEQQLDTTGEQAGGEHTLDSDDDGAKDASAPSYRRLYIRQQDLIAYGYTPDCSACRAIQSDQTRTGIHHSAFCRERIMKALEGDETGRQRLKELKEREDNYLANFIEYTDIVAQAKSAKRPRTR